MGNKYYVTASEGEISWGRGIFAKELVCGSRCLHFAVIIAQKRLSPEGVIRGEEEEVKNTHTFRGQWQFCIRRETVLTHTHTDTHNIRGELRVHLTG